MKTHAELIHDINKAEPPYGGLTFWWLGQHSFVVKAGERILYFDPYLEPSEQRLVPPLLLPKEVRHADFVFGSHDHLDHIDPFAIQGIATATRRTRFVVSRVAAQHLVELGVPSERIIALDEGLVYEEEGLRISAIAAAHEFLDRDAALGYPYLCFVVETGGVTIVHTGDTCKYDGMTLKLRRWSPDILFVPINGRDAVRLRRGCIGNMTYQEAVDLAGELRPRLTVPCHYDMFADNSADPSLFADYMDVKYPDLRYWIGGYGERIELAPPLADMSALQLE
jgi:L-ascorbate metabolism protein UlaG (beta-lactamase superfamily)